MLGGDERGYRRSLGSLLLVGHPIPGSIRSPRPRAGHVFGLPSQAPGALTQTSGLNSPQPIGTAHVDCHSLSLWLIQSRLLVAGSAPMQLRFHWLPQKLGTFTSFLAICPERCPSPCTRPHHPAIGLEIKARKGFWLTGKAIQSKPKRVTQNSSRIGLS